MYVRELHIFHCVSLVLVFAGLSARILYGLMISFIGFYVARQVTLYVYQFIISSSWQHCE